MIYKLIDDIKAELGQKIPPVEVEHVVGRGQVVEEFLINLKSSKVPVAGCRVNQGVFDRQKMFRVERGDACVVHQGHVDSLKHFKDETATVGVGKECGLKLADTQVRFQSGDTVVCYELKPEIPDLEWDTGF